MMTPKGEREERLLKVRTVAEMTDLSTSTIRRLLRGGNLVQVRIGKSVRVTEASVLSLIEKGR